MSACYERHVTDIVRGTWYACLLNFTFVTTRRSLMNNSNYKSHVSLSGLFNTTTTATATTTTTTTTTTTSTITTSNELLLLIIIIIIIITTTISTDNNVDC